MSSTVQVFLWIIAASFFFASLLGTIPKVTIPTAVSYILFGIALRLWVPLTLREQQWIGHMGEVGLLYLMFMSGLEINFAHLQKSGRSGPFQQSLQMLVPTVWLSLAGGFALALVIPEHPNPWLTALLLSSTSLSIVLPVLKEADLLEADEGQALLLYSLWTDLGVIILASFLLSLHTENPWEDASWTLVTLLLALALYGLLMWLRTLPKARARAGDLEHRTRGIIAAVAAFGAWADWTGSQPIMASFLIGIIVSLIPFAFKSLLKQAFYAIGYSFLIPIYFISVGMDLNPSQFTHSSIWFKLPLWVLVAFIIKLAAVWPLRQTYGMSTTLATGILSSARLGLVVVLADAGAKAGMLAPQTADTLVVFSIITSLLAPPLFMLVRGKPQT